jgi:hypothetical protein
MHDNSIRPGLTQIARAGVMSSEPTQTQELLALARGDLACYAVALWPQFSRAAYHELIISELQAVDRGNLVFLWGD